MEAEGSFTLTVDGEVFTVRSRPGEPRATDYDWVSGPNPGYGFSSTQCVAYGSVFDRAGSPTVDFQPVSIDQHRDSIRDFLGQINPETGYLGD